MKASELTENQGATAANGGTSPNEPAADQPQRQIQPRQQHRSSPTIVKTTKESSRSPPSRHHSRDASSGRSRHERDQSRNESKQQLKRSRRSSPPAAFKKMRESSRSPSRRSPRDKYEKGKRRDDRDQRRKREVKQLLKKSHRNDSKRDDSAESISDGDDVGVAATRQFVRSSIKSFRAH